MIQSTQRSLLAAVAFAAAALVPACALAQAALPQLPANPNIVVDYIEPMDPARLNFDPDDPNLPRDMKEKLAKVKANYEVLKSVRERLMSNRVLERYALFLTALKLPTTLRLRGRQCDEANAFYNRTDTSITLCYEYVAMFEARARRRRPRRASPATTRSSARSSARCCTKQVTRCSRSIRCRSSGARRMRPIRSPAS